MTWSRHIRPVTRLAIAAFYAAWLGACGYDVNVNAPGQNPPHTTDSTSTTGDSTKTGTFQRADLTITVTVTGADSAIASRVGSPTGVLANAVVTIQRQGSAGARTVDTTDAAGRATFQNLVAGYYTVAVLRLLAAGEVGTLDSADLDVSGFAGGTAVNLVAPSTAASVSAASGRRGSLVISEVFAAAPLVAGVGLGSYQYGNFIELYNNADTVVYLDGKVLGLTELWHRSYSPPRDCSSMAKWRVDPDGLWARYFDAFPGTGHSHPLQPGHAVVVATDAIDHSAIVPTMLNLSGADFEFHGSSDIDNPAVPNMLDIGLAEWEPSLLGHGLTLGVGDVAYFLSEPFDTANVPHDVLPVVGSEYIRIPSDRVLDVFTTNYTAATEAITIANGWTLCGPIIDERFDRQYASLYDPNVIQSMARRIFTTLPDGRVILLRTKSSANDFEVAQPTPGTVGK